MARPPVMSIEHLMLYEISSSWWARGISNDWLQNLAARYFAWKTKRKYARYKQHIERAASGSGVSVE